jgi:hypothetical protein
VKKGILSAIGSNLILRDKILCIEARKPFLILAQSIPCLSEAEPRIEPEKNGSRKAQSATFGDGLRPKLRGIDDDRTYASGKQLGWHRVGKEILLHVTTCKKECSELNITLDKLFAVVSEYQKQAA